MSEWAKETYERLDALAEALELSDSVIGVETLVEAVRGLTPDHPRCCGCGACRWVRQRDRGEVTLGELEGA